MGTYLNMNFIGVNQIDVNVCDTLIEYFEDNTDKHEVGSIIYDGDKIIDKDCKSTIELHYDNIPNDLKNLYLKELNTSVEKYIDTYPEINSLGYFQASEFQIQKYNAGDGFPTWHWERGATPETYYRCLAFMTYLNSVDDDAGGETEFKYQDIKVKPEKGKTIIWPADWTYTHRGNIIKSGNKYIVTGWFVNYL